jgi:hypothetical protein
MRPFTLATISILALAGCSEPFFTIQEAALASEPADAESAEPLDAASDAPDGSPAGDAAEAGAPRIRCGGGAHNLTYCDPVGETCCANSGDGGFVYSCVPRDQPGACKGLPIACAAQSDCADRTVCCFDSSGSDDKVACVAATSCRFGVLLCSGDGECPKGTRCVPFGGNVPYDACK